MNKIIYDKDMIKPYLQMSSISQISPMNNLMFSSFCIFLAPYAAKTLLIAVWSVSVKGRRQFILPKLRLSSSN